MAQFIVYVAIAPTPNCLHLDFDDEARAMREAEKWQRRGNAAVVWRTLPDGNKTLVAEFKP